MPLSPQEEVQFLVTFQRLLADGSCFGSYNFALLLALADLSVERGDDSGAPLRIATFAVAEKFVQYYWQQVLPFPPPGDGRVLQQNKGVQATIVNAVRVAHGAYGGSLARAMRDVRRWTVLVRVVTRILTKMPAWRLQTIGPVPLELLCLTGGDGRDITLKPGIAACFRKFHGLIGTLVRGAWLRYVREQNIDLLGEMPDLNEFLFGSEHNRLTAVRSVLMDLQRGRCFYCQRRIFRDAGHVDRFVCWSRYPADLGHNFVLIDYRCKKNKRDRLPAVGHLEKWAERNVKYGIHFIEHLHQIGIRADLAGSNRVTMWTYAQAEVAIEPTWTHGDELVLLPGDWRIRLKDASG